MKFLNDDEVLDYVKNELHFNTEDCKCKCCGGLVKWKDGKFNLMTRKPKSGKFTKWKNLKCYVPSFMSEREYNGNIYHLSYCYECACKMFPEIPEKKFPLNPATNRSKILFQISDEDFETVTDNICKRTKENYIKHFGEIEGLKKWNSYCKKQSETNTFEYKKEKYGWTKEQFQNFNSSRAVTLENLINRHGEKEGLRIWEEYKEKQRYTTTLEYFQKTYGESKGFEKWNNWRIKRQEYTYKGNSSSIANECFKMLIPFFPDDKIYTDILETKEYNLNSVYYLDYYDETLNIVVEFFGDFWHANPNIYQSDDILNKPLFLSAKEIWNRDEQRIKYIEKTMNTKVFIIWETDFRKNKKECINNIINEIKKYSERNQSQK